LRPPSFTPVERQGRLCLVASQDGSHGSVRLHQDARIYTALLTRGESVAHDLVSGRHAWIHVARGTVRMGDLALGEGDGAALSGPASIEPTGVDDAEVLLFDLH